MKRVGVAGFLHESNTFLPVPTTYGHFEQTSLTKGEGLIRRWEGGHHELSGFLEGARSNVPGGRILIMICGSLPLPSLYLCPR